MAYTMKVKLANRKNYGSQRKTSQIKYICIHYTSNDGDTDEGNGKYFANNVVKASAHYFVDDDSVTQSVKDDYVAWAVGGKKYNNAGGRLYGVANNTNTLNIEICDDVKNGKVYPSAKTIENAIAFTKAKMKEYNIPMENVIRHYDVNGKNCPAYWVDDAKWKTEFWNKLEETKTVKIELNVLKRGAKGEQVKTLQILLKGKGYDIDVDGSFGGGTEKIVKQYQKDCKLTVDGSVGQATWNSLLKYSTK
jgi:N-acetylmuramoyl-L-alanine amidase CwlA